MAAELRSTRAARTAISAEPWFLRLYTAGTNWRSELVLSRLTSLCEQHLPGGYRIEMVDLLAAPKLARADNILAVPTVKRLRPCPVMQVVGDLSNAERAARGLGLASAVEPAW